MSCVFLCSRFAPQTERGLWQPRELLEQRALRLALGMGVLLCVPSLSGCCLLNLYLKSAELKYPLPPEQAVQVDRDRTYKEVDGKRLLFDLYRPADAGEPLPVVIMIHGNGPQWMLDEAKDWGNFTGFGRAIAGRGHAAIAFNHRGSSDLSGLPEEASDVEAMVAYVRAHAVELGVDPERICLFSFSGGGAYVGWALRDRPAYLRGLVAYYSVLDLESVEGMRSDSVSAEDWRAYSASSHLQPGGAPAPRMLVARAGQDREDINRSIDVFVERARAAQLPIELLEHPEGRHGFDVLDEHPRTREIIARTLEFIDEVFARVEEPAQAASQSASTQASQ